MLVPFRIALIILALSVMRWSVKGLVGLWLRNFSPPCINLAVIFSFASATLLWQVAALVGVSDLWRLTMIVWQGCALGLATFAQRRRTAMRATLFYSMFDHLEHAVAITDLARVDPDAAGRLADEARRLTANVLVSQPA